MPLIGRQSLLTAMASMPTLSRLPISVVRCNNLGELRTGTLFELFDTDVQLGHATLLTSPDALTESLVTRFRAWLGRALANSKT
jgi:hypothetical protein